MSQLTISTQEMPCSYDTVIHVNPAHKMSADNNDGSSEAPLKTISEAARRAVAGTKVVIHQGTYRECVRPQAGGEGPEKMVLYEAAGDGDVVIKASEEVTEFEKSTGWIYMNHRIITTRHFPADKFTSIWKY